jgi:ATP-dependent exoDNAse (exonuclease V) alpha subunit
VSVRAVSPSGQEFVLPLACGDRLRFGARVDALSVINGTSAIVEGIDPREDGHARIVARVGDRKIGFDTSEVVDRRGRVRLAHDYAATIASSQGLTAESCTVLLEPTLDRNEFYVAASRSRGQTRFVVDEKAIDLIARSERRLNEDPRPSTREEREAALLRRLSRERVKTSSLEEARELTPVEVASRGRIERQEERPLGSDEGGRRREWRRELGHEL